MCKELNFTVSEVLEKYKNGQRFFYKTNAKDEKDKLHFIQDNSKKKIGETYYFFGVLCCGYDKNNKDYYINAYIQVPQVMYIDIQSKIVNSETGQDLLDFDKATCFHSKDMHYDMKKYINNPLLLDKGKALFYTTATIEYNGSRHELCVITDPDITFDYKHKHPAKQSQYIILNPTNKSEQNYIAPPNMNTSDNVRGGDDTINIALFRQPEKCDDLDYLCDFGKDSRGYPLFCVPLEGKLTIKSNNLTIKSAEISECIMQNGDIKISNKTDIKDTDINKNTLTFDLKQPWDKPFDFEGLWTEYIFEYISVITINIKNPDGTETSECYYITSKKDMIGDNTTNIKKISIMWGCVGEDSLILLQDKTTKKIKDITLDDIVLTSNGAKKLRNIWHGYSDKYIIIKADNKQLICSLDHPVMTKQGFKRAEKLSKDDKLLTYDNRYVNIDDIILKSEKIMTYNLAFEDDNELTMIAEGFVIGNFKAQNTPNIF